MIEDIGWIGFIVALIPAAFMFLCVFVLLGLLD